MWQVKVAASGGVGGFLYSNQVLREKLQWVRALVIESALLGELL